jgi:hypothetical protein
MSSIYSCDIPPRVWGREAGYQGKEQIKKTKKQKTTKKKQTKDRQTKINKENNNLSAVFSQEHTQMC